MRAPRIGTGGFLVADLLVALGFTAIVCAMTQSWVRSVLVTSRTHQQRLEAADEIEATLDLMVHEIHLAGFPGGGTGGLTAARADRLELQADLNRNGTYDDSNERITYAYRSTTRQLARATGRGNLQALVDDVPADGFQLVYRDASGAPLGSSGQGLDADQRRQVRCIEIQLSVATTRDAGRGSIRVERSAIVALRNR